MEVGDSLTHKNLSEKDLLTTQHTTAYHEDKQSLCDRSS